MGFNLNPEVMSELIRVGVPLVVDLIERRASKPIDEIPDTELLLMLRDPNLIADTDSAIEEGRERVRVVKQKSDEDRVQSLATSLGEFKPEDATAEHHEDDEIMPQDFPE
jgi:hypothetical protein